MWFQHSLLKAPLVPRCLCLFLSACLCLSFFPLLLSLSSLVSPTSDYLQKLIVDLNSVHAPRRRQARAKAGKHEVRVLLLTSPHNPTGRLYSPKALVAAVAWARKRGLHVVVDEVICRGDFM